MLIELIIALLIGIILGCITGLTPGIHINLVSAFVVSLSLTLFLGINPLFLVVFIVAMSITHTFVDYIPSVFLGAPDEDNFLSILPGHEMLIKGEAYSAVVYTLYGSLLAILIITLFSPIFYYFLPKLYPYAEKIMPLILVITSFFLIIFEKNKKFLALFIFILSGFLGLATLNLNLSQPLLPMFTGLFGISSLLTSIMKKQHIPKQTILSIKQIKLSRKSLFKSFFASILASPLCSFLPGLGSGQAAVIGSEIVGDLDRKEFLVLLGAINTIVTGLSFITLYTINKSRTGVAVAISAITKLNLDYLVIITLTIIFSGIIAFFATIHLAKLFSKNISKVNYKLLAFFIILILVNLVFIFSGGLGLLVMIISSCVGLTCILLGVRRTHLMGCLLIPTILLYLV